ncbi:hypothetical protein [Spirosoma pollinicola]|uniref:Uncharacterized protein n=1 Tax=Spirosoma pollinicola TaxID=2057025 RepID=A0A2K8Z7W9_9BACT|nr:hypothetical protein [Spirosoma pollinicola]AUD05944.1 hypothetical protein CWM47_31330 [Spirosoma pollinicola]
MSEHDATALKRIKEQYSEAQNNVSVTKLLWDHTSFFKEWRNDVYYLNINNCSDDFKNGVKKLISSIDNYTGNANSVAGHEGIKKALNPMDFSSITYFFDTKSRAKEFSYIGSALEELEQIAKKE